jgi:VacB/RNase II family 3'-5' exoribonuclease
MQPERFDLVAGARQAMIENGFSPDIPEAARAELRTIPEPSVAGVRDLRKLLWSSIDNDESRDLDQIEVAEPLADGHVRVLVGVADVDALVRRDSALDVHALRNTSSVYTGVAVFPMLPDELSTDRTSLNEGGDRLAVVIDMRVAPDGHVVQSEVYRALVHNRAKLSYDEVGAWLEGSGPAPRAIASDAKLAEQIRLQDAAAQTLKKRRYEYGALDLETLEARPVVENGKVIRLELTKKNRARDLIEDFMIAANGAMARFLDAKGVSSIRRVVKAPERWQRIVALATSLGESLPPEPSSIALAALLAHRKAKAPDEFADLSLAVVKLMGPGEYALERAGYAHDGHFGLAMQDYTHSTAPNRRFADLVTQRLVKAAAAGEKAPYTDDDLAAIAARCTMKENDARKVERTTRKQAAALLLSDRLGAEFDAIVTGVMPKGTFVRLVDPPAEARVVKGQEGLDVGDHLRARLVATEPSRGFIDVVRVRPSVSS